MSRIVKVSENNYKVSVQSGGVITLDTGNQTGVVRITGDLTVLGNTSTVESETLTIKDNIIYLNNGEAGNGVTLKTSGIQIDRGTALDAVFVFDEDIVHYNPSLATTTFGTFSFKLTNGLMRGIKTNSITTGGTNLGLINSGTGVVTVTGTQNYHDQVQNGSDPDVLVTRGWVTRYVNSSGYPTGVAIVDRLYSSDTGIQAYDDTLYGGDSNIKFKFDNVVKATFNSTTFNMNVALDINGKTLISNNVISAQTAGDNLKLVPAPSKSIEIDGPIQLNDTTGPTAITNTTKLYTLDSDNTDLAVHTGKTGIYFTSLSSSDELIAKNRALLWSMLF
jgi:hypothetical protein